MKLQTMAATALAALALVTAPTAALADQPATHGQGNGNANGHGPVYAPPPVETPGPGATLPEKAKAYGVYCKGQSKKHVAGEKGTRFSQCVTAMAKAAHDEKLSPGQACKGMSRKHVKGQKGTPFSRCVNAAAKLRKDQQEG